MIFPVECQLAGITQKSQVRVARTPKADFVFRPAIHDKCYPIPQSMLLCIECASPQDIDLGGQVRLYERHWTSGASAPSEAPTRQHFSRKAIIKSAL